jgi:hypothetical protein
MLDIGMMQRIHLKLIQSVVSGHVRALEWFGTSASITAVVSEYVRVLEWCGASS